ncbi:MAG: enoyl-CoA hydratase/isomerase family protein [Planctomycetia bacterium]|nr:enoyl-CoA hydratase/isomerase family protein [Planctomycetia bacterium]
MTQPLVRINVHEHTGTIILNRPERRNALSRELMRSLVEAIGDLHLERRVRAVVLTGAGSAFCAGMDLDEMHATTKMDDPRAQWHEDSVQYLDLLESMLRFPKPLIAAVNGPAVAGGAGLALACDIVLAANNAQFGFPEARRGIVAGLVAPLLVFRIGAGHAARLLLTGGLIDAQEAFRIGVFHRLVDADHLWPQATDTAAECAHCAPEALSLTKRMLNETIGEQLSTMLVAGAAVSATSRTTEAAAEGLAAFLEKRPPKWP